jgi:MoxR-like ATPase
MRELYEAVAGEVEKVVVGQEQMTATALAALSLGGHVLLEGPPGVAKTLLVRTLAATLGSSFARIQFTPDLMPSDVTGTGVFHPREGEFRFQPGPVFAQFVLCDEINRAPAKTQAALLEAMQEGAVTIDGKRHELPRPFSVFATMNPIEHEGTYPLP